MRVLLVATLAALAMSATATAGNPSLCARDGYQTAQASNGATFNSIQECAKARDVYQPSLTITPGRVVAEERFTLTASGFHPNASVVVLFAITGQQPYNTYTPFDPTNADGTFSIPIVFGACGTGTTNLTITLVDSFGVHASAPLVLC